MLKLKTIRSMTIKSAPSLAAVVFATLFVQPIQTAAQDQDDGAGFTRIQGRDPAAPALPAPAVGGPILDYREEMRTFIQGISTYARSLNPSFMVVARDAGDLLIKRDVQDERRISPARTFMRSIDGVMLEGVFLGYRAFGQAPEPEIQAQIFERIERAKRSGLRVLVQDFARGRQAIDQVLRAAEQRGVVASVGHLPPQDLTEIPPYPARPNRENPKNILSLQNVENFVYIADPSGYGRQDTFALKFHDNNFDLVIVEPFLGREPLSRRAVETLKYKKLGARRLVFAKMDIGTVASYRYYWQQGWREGVPSWIAGSFPDDPDRYFVEYWQPGWQQVIYGNPNSFVYGLVAQGYDGVLVEGMRNYLAFEGNVEVPAEFAPMTVPTQ